MIDAIKELLESKDHYTLDDFRRAMPGTPEQTVVTRIHALEKKGIIRLTGRGEYARGAKMAYRAEISDWMRKVSGICDGLVGVDYCLSGKRPGPGKMPYDGNLLLEVHKEHIAEALALLRENGQKALPYRDALPVLEQLDGFVIVRPMVSGSVVLNMEGVPVPSLEKMLVDLVADSGRLFIAPDAIQKNFQRAFEVYAVNRSRLMRYAGRRNVQKAVSEHIEALNSDRISLITKIQSVLATQPIERAWLFGSFARGEERADSDVDLLVDYTDSDNLSLLDLARISNSIEKSAQREVDIVENGYLIPQAIEHVEQDKILVYERTA